jgi:hypothetical protein
VVKSAWHLPAAADSSRQQQTAAAAKIDQQATAAVLCCCSPVREFGAHSLGLKGMNIQLLLSLVARPLLRASAGLQRYLMCADVCATPASACQICTHASAAHLLHVVQVQQQRSVPLEAVGCSQQRRKSIFMRQEELPWQVAAATAAEAARAEQA